MRHPDGAERECDVKDSAKRQREDDADRHVARGTLGFFRGYRHGIETDVRKKHERGAGKNSVITEGRKRMQVGRRHRVCDNRDEYDHRGDLQKDQRAVGGCRFANADPPPVR